MSKMMNKLGKMLRLSNSGIKLVLLAIVLVVVSLVMRHYYKKSKEGLDTESLDKLLEDAAKETDEELDETSADKNDDKDNKKGNKKDNEKGNEKGNKNNVEDNNEEEDEEEDELNIDDLFGIENDKDGLVGGLETFANYSLIER